MFCVVKRNLYSGLASMLILLFALFHAVQIDKEPWGIDTQDTLVLCLNLAKYGDFSFNDSLNNQARYPSNYREPLPIFVWASVLVLADQQNKINSIDGFQNASATQWMKRSNVIFLLVLLVAIWYLIQQIPNNYLDQLSKLIAFAIYLCLLKYSYFLNGLNTINTDLHSAALQCLLMCFLVRYFKSRSKTSLIGIGLVYGLLCLTKASFLYSGALLVVTIATYHLIRRQTLVPLLMVLGVTLSVIGPWILRNAIMTEQAVISGRGPETFVDRTYEARWNDAHALGLLYAYGPDFLRPLMTRLTGYGFEDRLKGGRLQYSTRAHTVDMQARKLGDEKMAINSHFKAGIWMTHVYQYFYEQTCDPLKAKKLSAKVYQRFAMSQMLNHPFRHLKFTLIFAYRGMWILNAIDGRTAYEMGEGKKEPVLREAIAFFGLFSCASIFIWATRNKHHQLLMLSAVPLSLYFFQSFFSHNLPRYTMQLVPVLLLSLVYVMLGSWRQFIRKNKVVDG